MRNEIVKLETFYIIGISVRTTNQNGQSERDIGELWEKLMRLKLPEKIPNKLSEAIYCLYTDYENDQNGAYTTIIGSKVSSLKTIPDGFIGKQIPASTYQIYTSTGKIPDCVSETWMKIWQSNSNRRFLADFDVYDEKARDFKNAEVKTFLSIN